ASDGVARGALAPAPSAPAVIGHDAAGQHRPIGLQPLAHDLQAEVIEASERGQVRGSEGSVRHVEVFPVGSVRTPIIERPRPLSHERRADAHARLYTATPTPWIRKSRLSRGSLRRSPSPVSIAAVSSGVSSRPRNPAADGSSIMTTK